MEEHKKQNLLTFGLSLLIALYVWGYVTNLGNPIQTKTFNDTPIQIINVDSLEAQNLSIDSSSIPKVTSVVEGRFSELQGFDSSQLLATVDLKDLALKEGTNAVMVEVESLSPFVDIVKEKTTLKIEVEVEKIVQKEIPVVVQLNGLPADGYVYLDAVTSKNKVIVSGSKNDLDEMKYVLAVVDVTGAESNVEVSAKLTPINKYGEESKNVVSKDKEIGVVIPIKFTKTVPIELNIIKDVDSQYSLVSSRLKANTITIYGEKADLDLITAIKTEGVDLSRRAYDFDKLLALDFPKDVGPLDKDNTSVYASFIIERN